MAKNVLSHIMDDMGRYRITGTRRQPSIVEAVNYLNSILPYGLEGCYVTGITCDGGQLDSNILLLSEYSDSCPVCGQEQDVCGDNCPVCKKNGRKANG